MATIKERLQKLKKTGQNIKEDVKDLPEEQMQAAEGKATEPTTPEVSEDVKRRREKQRKAIQEALTPTEEERETKKEIQNLRASEQMGVADVKDQPIAMPFIRGQAAGIERQTQARVEPLQQKLARLQKERQQQADVAEQKLKFARQDIKTERQQQEALAKRQRQQREDIRTIAEDLRTKGATEEDVQKVLQAEDRSQAQEVAAGVELPEQQGVASFAQAVQSGQTDLSSVPADMRAQVAENVDFTQTGAGGTEETTFEGAVGGAVEGTEDETLDFEKFSKNLQETEIGNQVVNELENRLRMSIKPDQLGSVMRENQDLQVPGTNLTLGELFEKTKNRLKGGEESGENNEGGDRSAF